MFSGKKLYEDLMNLCNTSEVFYYVDQEKDGFMFRIFAYRLASYSDFQQPSALECRGHMFQITPDGKYIRLASIPFEKFFNYRENPFTMNLDLNQSASIMEKRDGSLITTYSIGHELYLKSKTSLKSDQVIQATEWLNRPENAEFKRSISFFESIEWTVIMEWTSPDNRIVIGYENPGLTVLGIRSTISGAYYDNLFNEVNLSNHGGFLNMLRNTGKPSIAEHWVSTMSMSNLTQFVESVPGMTDNIEGYVVQLKDGTRFKIKTNKYCSLHHSKDSVNCPRRLFEVAMDEGLDDLRSMFWDDPSAIKLITDMEQKVEKNFNHFVARCQDFHTKHKHLSRKEFAIKGRVDLTPMEFTRAMRLFTGEDPQWKQYYKSKWKELGFSDSKQEVILDE